MWVPIRLIVTASTSCLQLDLRMFTMWSAREVVVAVRRKVEHPSNVHLYLIYVVLLSNIHPPMLLFMVVSG